MMRLGARESGDSEGRGGSVAKKFVLPVAILATLMLVLSSCARGGGGEGSKTVGYAGPTLNNAFFVGLQKGVRDGAKEYGFELKETNANDDAGTQFNQAQNLITQDVDALILVPIDSEGIVPAVQAANNADIPVFTLDRGADGGEIASEVETNNIQAGQKAANYIVNLLKERYGKPQGNVVDLQGLVGTTAAADREKGFQGVMKKYPDIDIVANQPADFDQEKALNVTTNILQANKEVDAIFGANDDNTVGAIRAIDSAGRYEPPSSDEHIYIVGIDGTAQALQAIRRGKQTATVSQNPIRMAETTMKFIDQQLNEGKKPPKQFFYPTIIIDKQNIDSQEVKEYGIWSKEVQ
jgi:ribose transport system substrate-binding protein